MRAEDRVNPVRLQGNECVELDRALLTGETVMTSHQVFWPRSARVVIAATLALLVVTSTLAGTASATATDSMVRS
jgi:hypothetical protein